MLKEILNKNTVISSTTSMSVCTEFPWYDTGFDTGVDKSTKFVGEMAKGGPIGETAD